MNSPPRLCNKYKKLNKQVVKCTQEYNRSLNLENFLDSVSYLLHLHE